VLLFLLLTLACAAVGIGLHAFGAVDEAQNPSVQLIAGGLTALLAIYLWRTVRTAKGLFPILLVACAALFYFSGSLILTAVLCALLFAIGEGSFLLAVLPRKQLVLFPLTAILAYAATLAYSRDPLGAAVAVLIPLLPMPVLALCTRNSAAREDGLTRVGVICAGALALGVSMGAMTLLSLYRITGSLDPEALLGFLEELRAALIHEITSAELPEGLSPEMAEKMKEMQSHANAENAVNSAFNLLPALFVVAVNLITAAAQSIQHAALRTFGFGDSLTDRVREFAMSLISCVVFLAAYLVAFFEGTEASTLAGTVAQNIYIILMPGLALAGMLRITRGLVRKGPRGVGCLFYLVILIPCLLIFAPFLLAAVEVIGHIFGAVSSALKPPQDDDPF
jgi:hypothetical protein